MFTRRISLLIILVLSISLLVGCGALDNGTESYGKDDEIVLVDAADRQVTIAAGVERVFSTGPVGTILIYSLNPGKMVGWNYDLREDEKRYILEEYHSLPNLGGASKASINMEEVIKVDPDVLIMVDSIDEATKSKADEMEEQTGKPVVLLEEDIYKLSKTYEILGKIMEEEERAEELSKYCRETLEEAKINKDIIAEEQRVSLYYAEGPDGLQTEPAGSWHAEIIDIVGGINVAQVDAKGNKGKSEVSIEQLLSWDPEVIISWGDERGGCYSKILKDTTWEDIRGVKDCRVYEIPNRPFNWFDRPPSANRILGVKWMGNLLYPDVFDYNIRDEVREFYYKFYHYKLKDHEIEELLRNSTDA